MAQVIWTEPALSDLDEIADYIALDNIDAARRLIRKVFSGIEHLEQFPDSGYTPPELEHTKCLKLAIEPCRVFYRSDNNKVLILHVMRSERKLRKYLIDNQA